MLAVNASRVHFGRAFQLLQSRNVTLVTSLFCTTGAYSSRHTLCENNNNNDKNRIAILRKDKDGNVQWDESIAQLGDDQFWHELAKVAGSRGTIIHKELLDGICVVRIGNVGQILIKVQGVIDSGVPTQLSYGFISGYCSGMALKRVGRMAATTFGLGFIALQTLAYKGYINVDHMQIKSDMMGMLDLNKDGKVDADDYDEAVKETLKVLQYNLPGGSGFVGGFLGGLRSG